MSQVSSCAAHLWYLCQAFPCQFWSLRVPLCLSDACRECCHVGPPQKQGESSGLIWGHTFHSRIEAPFSVPSIRQTSRENAMAQDCWGEFEGGTIFRGSNISSENICGSHNVHETNALKHFCCLININYIITTNH